MSNRQWCILSVALICFSGNLSLARTGLQQQHELSDPPIAAASPAVCATVHAVGRIVLSVTNYGMFAAQGTGANGALINEQDCFTGSLVLACEYPKRSGTQYAYTGAFWIGAIVGNDTLVSVGADGWSQAKEMFPDEAPFGNMIRRSIIDPESPEFDGAVSEQDFIAVYTDTYTAGVAGIQNDFFGRPHRPLNVEVTQRSYSWSYPYADDFVLFDYSIRNIGSRPLTKVYMGIYVDADVGPAGEVNSSQYQGDLTPGALEFQDDICGFRETNLETLRVGNQYIEYLDTVNIAWIADVSGDLDDAGQTAVPAITATRIVRTPARELDVSFNWWIGNETPSQDFGPQAIRSFRDFNTGGTGTPEGDVNKYHVMSNREFDYDQIYTASIPPNDETWLTPPQSRATDFANGYDTRYLLSFGPFSIDPGQSLPISFAYVGGESFHTDPENAERNLGAGYNPELYYANLSFDNLATNSRWASWVYDNPGVDTDGDSVRGKFFVVCSDSIGLSIDTNATDTGVFIDTTVIYRNGCDTAYYTGDGVPDFRGASPPPAPELWLIPEVGRITVRFNGQRSETTRDVFSGDLDFEGYKVYLGRDDREASFSLAASYDRENFNKLVYDYQSGTFKLIDIPYTLDSLTRLYGNGSDDWDPAIFTRNNPYRGDDDSAFAFEPQGYNRSEFGVTTPIRKTYAEWRDLFPGDYGVTSTDSVPDSLKFLLTDDGYFKYYEYQIALENLLPTVPYFVNVTCTDYGSPASGLPALESSKTVNAKDAYPLQSVDIVQAAGSKAYVWPNPYRADADYLSRGFEGRFSPYSQPIPDRERRIHFANLPPKCTIKIFTLDGDLVREIRHESSPSDPNAMHEEWDMITRNTQMIVSGIYYWTVETPGEQTQIGKLVVIM